ncbi:YdcY family protein [Scandinavium sp. H11S7]|uniref:YdcY family protein n=1 Tax=Scandinavium hiltneri TaxID=2926519 RepID=UPI002165BFD1|nr:YdcY family protein [Scandinavium hiltneri]MCS2158967.1 YdcY family protein [Scandinavium hiltneri]
MSHLDEVSTRVDAAIEDGSIIGMNELLIVLSDDAELSREDRYTQQQRLRTAIAHKGRHHKEEEDARQESLTKGGTII